MPHQLRGPSVLAFCLLAYGLTVLGANVAVALLALNRIPPWAELLGVMIGCSSLASGLLLRRSDARAPWAFFTFWSLLALWLLWLFLLVPGEHYIAGLAILVVVIALGYAGFRYIARHSRPAA